MILVEGELQTRQYTDKNSNSGIWHEIVADRICFTGEKKSADAAEPDQGTSGNSVNGVENKPVVNTSDDGYPF